MGGGQKGPKIVHRIYQEFELILSPSSILDKYFPLILHLAESMLISKVIS